MADVATGGVPFAEAISFLTNKVDLPTRTWTDLFQGMHARAFVVSGAVKAALIADFHEAVNKAIAEGRTLADFRKDFDRIVAKHGWSYKGSRGWRSRVIYGTNMRMATNAGRWAQIQRLKKTKPYVRYVAVMDGRTRPEHRAWHDTILPVDDPFWRTHAPPNGWNCRCKVQPFSARDLKRRGKAVTDPPPRIEKETRQVNTPEGKVSLEVPKGIDTGFAYNVGDAAWGRGASKVAQERHGPWQALSAPGGNRPQDPGNLTVFTPKASIGERTKDPETLKKLMNKSLGADDAVLVDPLGARIQVGQGIVDHLIENTKRMDGREAFFPFIPELIEDPEEIWAGFAESSISGRVLIRRRYAKLLQIGKNRTVSLVADLDGGIWSGLTFFPGKSDKLKNIRNGLRIYKKE